MFIAAALLHLKYMTGRVFDDNSPLISENVLSHSYREICVHSSCEIQRYCFQQGTSVIKCAIEQLVSVGKPRE